MIYSMIAMYIMYIRLVLVGHYDGYDLLKIFIVGMAIKWILMMKDFIIDMRKEEG